MLSIVKYLPVSQTEPDIDQVHLSVLYPPVLSLIFLAYNNCCSISLPAKTIKNMHFFRWFFNVIEQKTIANETRKIVRKCTGLIWIFSWTAITPTTATLIVTTITTTLFVLMFDKVSTADKKTSIYLIRLQFCKHKFKWFFYRLFVALLVLQIYMNV